MCEFYLWCSLIGEDGLFTLRASQKAALAKQALAVRQFDLTSEPRTLPGKRTAAAYDKVQEVIDRNPVLRGHR